MKRGLFITLEGGEGLGKTLQARLLSDRMRGWGHRVILTREPGGTPIGKQLRELLLHSGENLAPQTELLLMVAERAQHVAELIKPALDEGQVVICDRYFDSTTAYQGWGRGWDQDILETLHHVATGGLTPHLTFVLHGTPFRELGDDRFEKQGDAFHERVCEGFASLAGTADRYVMINANQPEDVVAAEIVHHVLRRL